MSNTDITVNKIPYFEELRDDVKAKKELSALDDDFIEKKLEEFFSNISHHQDKDKALLKLGSSKSYKQFSKSQEHDFLIKEIRSELRKVYGAFILEEYSKKEKVLKKLRANMAPDESMAVHAELLSLHKSTKERMSHYKDLYRYVFDHAHQKMKGKYVILDIACGLNPISSIYFRDDIKKYYASDISTSDCEFLKEYFSRAGIANTVFAMDIADVNNYPTLSKIKCDLCFIFKALDGIERVKRDVTQKLLEAIDTKIFVITFPTLSLGGVREIKEFRRAWLERVLDRLGWTWEKREIENELVYLIDKN